MCGINGIFAYHHAANPIDRAELARTRDHMAARGPDDQGGWLSRDGRIGFGHRRLSIIDLSDAGHQPMRSACGRYTIVFNGEIYNYPELRSALESQGRTFVSNSDTEVLLHLFEMKAAEMINDLRGMFAFGIWDESERQLFLARDPYGIKPLYYADDGWNLRFASQVKALLAGAGVSTDPDPAGVCGFYLWGSVPDPHTLYRDIRGLPAGHYMIVDDAGPHPPRAYFSISEVLASGAAAPLNDSDIDDCARKAARETVAAHLLADVDVGLFLSAGIDSGALLGLMRDSGAEKIRAITLAFAEFRNTDEDESNLAAQVADHYGADHVIRVIDENEFLADLPIILANMDQPSIDGVNIYFVAKAAKEAGLKVALSGLGSDELLGGYPSFTDIPDWVRKMHMVSAVPGLGVIGRHLLTAAGAAKDNPKVAGLPQYGGTYPGAYLLRRGLFLPWEIEEIIGDPAMVGEGLRRLGPLAALRRTLTPDPGAPSSRVAALESSHYMRHQLLRDADWAGMAHSLEIRVPLVDIQFLQSIAPVTPRLRGRRGKMALAMAPSSPLPDHVRNRAKTGFGVPTGAWLAKVVSGKCKATTSKGAASRDWAQYVLDAQCAASDSGASEKGKAVA